MQIIIKINSRACSHFLNVVKGKVNGMIPRVCYQADSYTFLKERTRLLVLKKAAS